MSMLWDSASIEVNKNDFSVTWKWWEALEAKCQVVNEQNSIVLMT